MNALECAACLALLAQGTLGAHFDTHTHTHYPPFVSTLHKTVSYSTVELQCHASTRGTQSLATALNVETVFVYARRHPVRY